MSWRDGAARCDMTEDCPGPVSYIDDKGFLYCADHGPCRKHYRRCRKLTGPERKAVCAGYRLRSYYRVPGESNVTTEKVWGSA